MKLQERPSAGANKGRLAFAGKYFMPENAWSEAELHHRHRSHIVRPPIIVNGTSLKPLIRLMNGEARCRQLRTLPQGRYSCWALHKGWEEPLSAQSVRLRNSLVTRDLHTSLTAQEVIFGAKTHHHCFQRPDFPHPHRKS